MQMERTNMNIKKKLSRIVSSNIKERRKEDSKLKSIPNIFASIVSENIIGEEQDKSSPKVTTPIDPEKCKRYIQRGVEEVNQMMDDLNFDLNEGLGKGKVEFGAISLPEDGSAIINLKKSFAIEDEDILKSIAPSARKMTIRDEFAKYVTFNIVPPANLSKDLVVAVKIIIPSNVVDTLVKTRSDIGKVGKAIEKYGKQLMKSL